MTCSNFSRERPREAQRAKPGSLHALHSLWRIEHAMPLLFLCLLLCAACSHKPKLLVPACANPLPITGQYDKRSPTFWTKIAGRQAAADVAGDYGLTLAFEGSTVLSFPASIAPAILAKMRCDKRIQFISYSEYLENVLARTPGAPRMRRSSEPGHSGSLPALFGVRAAQLNRQRP